MKEILIKDAQKSCGGCELNECGEHFWFCRVTGEKTNINLEVPKPDWCPLRPLPIRRGKATLTERSQDTDMIVWQLKSNLYSEGWNDCLDEITGKTE